MSKWFNSNYNSSKSWSLTIDLYLGLKLRQLQSRKQSSSCVEESSVAELGMCTNLNTFQTETLWILCKTVGQISPWRPPVCNCSVNEFVAFYIPNPQDGRKMANGTSLRIYLFFKEYICLYIYIYLTNMCVYAYVCVYLRILKLHFWRVDLKKCEKRYFLLCIHLWIFLKNHLEDENTFDYLRQSVTILLALAALEPAV